SLSGKHLLFPFYPFHGYPAFVVVLPFPVPFLWLSVSPFRCFESFGSMRYFQFVSVLCKSRSYHHTLLSPVCSIRKRCPAGLAAFCHGLPLSMCFWSNG